MQSIGDEVLGERADRVVADLPEYLVNKGFCWALARRSSSPRLDPVRAALLCSACMPISGEWAFGPWPTGVPVQIHGKAQEIWSRESVTKTDD